MQLFWGAVLVSAALQPECPHRLTLTPERTELGSCDPLLMRIELSFGDGRPSNYWTIFDAHTGGIAVEVLAPGESRYRLIHTFAGGTKCVMVPPKRPPVPAGTRVAAHYWIISHNHEFYAFDKPGDYLVRAGVGLVDQHGTRYAVRSVPQRIRVRADLAPPAVVVDAVRPTLYIHLDMDMAELGPAARTLTEALPKLGGTVTASAVERLLVLRTLRHAKIGDEFDLAVIDLDRLRNKLPPVGQEHLDVAAAEVLLDRGEADAALVRLKRVPDGPRKRTLMSVHESLTAPPKP